MGAIEKTGTQKTHAEQLHESQLKKKRQFQANVSLTWLVLFILLLLVFSSYEFKSSNGVTELSIWQYQTVTKDGREVLEKTRTVLTSLPFGLSGEGITIKTILVDRTFVRENFSFIAGGLYWTVRISLFSIILATILALLAALTHLVLFMFPSFEGRPFIYRSCSSSLHFHN